MRWTVSTAHIPITDLVPPRNRTRTVGTLVVLALGLLTPACGGNDSGGTTSFKDTRKIPTTTPPDVVRDTRALLRQLSKAVKGVLRPTRQDHSLAELRSIERRARRLADRAMKLPEHVAARGPLLTVNLTAARTAWRLREIVRLAKDGKQGEARSRARQAADELRRSINRLEQLHEGQAPPEGTDAG